MPSLLMRLAGVLFLSFAVLSAPALAQAPGAAKPAAVKTSELRNDVVIGAVKAPHVLDMYVSYTCPHCRDYWVDELPKIDAELVKTGKLRINVRPAIFNNLDLIVSVATGCLPEAEREAFVATIYKDQPEMMEAAKGGQNLAPFILDRLAARGLANEPARTCLKDDSRAEAIMTGFDQTVAAVVPQMNAVFGEECKARTGKECQGLMTPLHALDGKLLSDGSLDALKTLIAAPAKKPVPRPSGKAKPN